MTPAFRFPPFSNLFHLMMLTGDSHDPENTKEIFVLSLTPLKATYFCTTPSWFRGTEKARLAEKWLSEIKGDPRVRRGRERCVQSNAEVTHAVPLGF